MMEMNADDARRFLNNIDGVERDTKRKTGLGAIGSPLMIWGLVWIVCYAIVYWLPQYAGKGWLIGDGIGVFATICFGVWDSRKKEIVSTELRAKSKRIWIAWGCWAAFLFGILYMAWPMNGMQFGSVIVLMVMFMFVVTGLWLEVRFLIFIGCLIAAMTVLGYVLAEHEVINGMRAYALWMSVVCGGLLFGSGVYARVRLE
ncbi:hypothetical protein JD969_08705 [Planctomycetota bacterium]|nr:hypothetical protein JD969_08705 [Planctomycetota bacterium]